MSPTGFALMYLFCHSSIKSCVVPSMRANLGTFFILFLQKAACLLPSTAPLWGTINRVTWMNNDFHSHSPSWLVGCEFRTNFMLAFFMCNSQYIWNKIYSSIHTSNQTVCLIHELFPNHSLSVSYCCSNKFSSSVYFAFHGHILYHFFVIILATFNALTGWFLFIIIYSDLIRIISKWQTSNFKQQ